MGIFERQSVGLRQGTCTGAVRTQKAETSVHHPLPLQMRGVSLVRVRSTADGRHAPLPQSQRFHLQDHRQDQSQSRTGLVPHPDVRPLQGAPHSQSHARGKQAQDQQFQLHRAQDVCLGQVQKHDGLHQQKLVQKNTHPSQQTPGSLLSQ